MSGIGRVTTQLYRAVFRALWERNFAENNLVLSSGQFRGNFVDEEVEEEFEVGVQGA